MVKKQRPPDRGDIVILSFSPQLGHEQRGRRPALVLSPQSYNNKTGLCVCVPCTQQIKGYPFEVVLTNTKTRGVILADHVKNLDWRVREAEFVEKVSPETLLQVRDTLGLLL